MRRPATPFTLLGKRVTVPIMRPPEELDSVDWASLRHGMREDASNVPRIIRALYTDDGRSARDQVRSLWVLNRWAEVYSATSPRSRSSRMRPRTCPAYGLN